MSPRAKKIAMQVTGLAISIALLSFLFYKIEFKELLIALKEANYWWLIPNIILIMVTMVFRAYRWKHMVAPIREIPLPRLFSITMIGFMANNLLPFRLGEFVRAYSLSSKEQVSKSASLATIFVERIVFDLLALLAIFGIVLIISPLTVFKELKIGAIVTIITGLIGLTFAFYLSSHGQRDSHILKRLISLFPERFRASIEGTVARFATGLEFMRSGKRVFWVTYHTFMIWVIMGISNYFILLAFGFGNLPLTASFVILVVVSILITVPSSPGFVGVYHYGTVLSLQLYGVSPEQALSCALVMHATQFLVITIVGLYYLRREHLSLKEIEQEAEKRG
jgi:glycosyltransferase 2 family protein